MNPASGCRLSIALGILVALAIPWAPVAVAAPGEWEIISSPNPGPTFNRLTEVARLGSNGVLALGEYASGFFALEWDGTAWTEVAMPQDVGMGYDVSGLGSTPAGDPWAVGIVLVEPGTALPLAMRYNGSQWDVIEPVVLDPSGRDGHAFDVSATAEDDAWAVGNVTGGALAIHWDGAGWTEIAPPLVGNRQNNLTGVAAVAADDVWAVGDFEDWAPADPIGFFAMILHWDGATWSHFPNPAQALEGTILLDVEAVAADDVWAGGFWSHGLCNPPSGPSQCDPFFMHWDGLEWAIVPGPVTESPYVRELTALATDDIWARTATEYLHWDGAAWSVVAPPEVPDAEAVSHGVAMAAVGPGAAWAVGSYDPVGGDWTRTLTERLVNPSLFADGFESGDTSAWSSVVP